MWTILRRRQYGRREIDVRVEELVDQRTDGVGLGQRLELILELEVLKNVLNIWRRPVKVVLEVSE